MTAADGSPRPLPTDAELRILQELWRLGPSTVRDIHEGLGREREVRYTTVLKTLQTMHQKGLVVRDDSERSHVYTASVDREWATRAYVTDLTDRVFEGSTARLVLGALSAQPATRDELAEIRQLLRQMEDES